MPEIREDLDDTSNQVSPVTGTELVSKSKKTPLQLARDGQRGKAAKRIVKDWDDSYRQMRSNFAQWKANKARHSGFTGVTCVKQKDDKVCRIPLNATNTFGGMNKAARLSRRITSQLFSDPPLPDVTPEGKSDEERDAAEFSTRALQIIGDPSDLDFAGTAREAFDRGGNYGSGFRHYWIDPKGNGHRPTQILAHPDAQTIEEALLPEGDRVLRYVMEDGKLTDEPKEAKRTWLPRLRLEILTGKHVRFHPQQVRDISEADGVTIGAMVPYGTVKALFPAIDDLSDDQKLKVV